MTWETFKTFVKEKMDGDGISSVATDVTAYSTFDIRCMVYFKKYTRETYQAFYPYVEIDWVTNDDQYINLGASPADGTTPVIFEPKRVWLDTTEIQEITMEEMDRTYPQSGSAATGTPGYWAKWREKYLWFNTPIDAATNAAGIYVAGWGEQPNFTSVDADNDVLICPDEEVDMAAEYVALHFMKPQVSDAIGANRLEIYMSDGGLAIAMTRARNLARFNVALRKGQGRDAL